ncbi:hypothetical protein H7X46_12820 [Pseudonocardia sp. C8]|uniref:hypothetical protein n=1 Tax=Pseudonocardia sp. C8 TaxID=2762759 RepID=UPI0016427215|nr:hypothetical protein [Pseudonocardia sp. C8]MBC3191947.1 hypothetical protein [Pseudonocardia sp. C8]
MAIDLNLDIDDTGAVVCRHCGATVGASVADPLGHAVRHERPSVEAGPAVHAAPSEFVDRDVVLRQAFCPGCLALVFTEIVPAGEPSYRVWSLT